MIYISDILLDKEIQTVLEQVNAGIESIEFSISDNLDCLDEKIQAYGQRMHSLNVCNLTLHGPFLDLNPVAYDSKIKDATLYRFAQAYDAAFRLGASKIIYHTCFVPSIYFVEGWAERMAEFWNPFLEDRKDIQVLIENVYDPNPEPILKAKELVEAANFKLCLDIGHANCYSTVPLTKWIQCFGKHIGHVHVHDNDTTYDSHLGLGMGSIEVETVLQQLRETTPNATYTIECTKYEDVMQSYHYLKK